MCGPEKFVDVDLHVVLVVFGQRLVGLAEQQMLVLADRDLRGGAVAVHDLGRHVDHLLIELAMPLAVPTGTSNST